MNNIESFNRTRHHHSDVYKGVSRKRILMILSVQNKSFRKRALSPFLEKTENSQRVLKNSPTAHSECKDYHAFRIISSGLHVVDHVNGLFRLWTITRILCACKRCVRLNFENTVCLVRVAIFRLEKPIFF